MSIKVTAILNDQLEKVNIRPYGNDVVTVKQSGNITDISYSQCRSHGGVTKKLDRDHYIDLRDGTVKEFQHNENRLSDTKSVKRSLEQGRDMINANVTDPAKALMLTLTYAENMRDRERLYTDFKRFWHRGFMTAYPDCEKYILSAEPQGRGAWHLHVIAIFKNQPPFIPNDTLNRMWRHGFVKIRKVDNVDNVGAYLSAYLADLPLEEAFEQNPQGKFKAVDVLMPDENGNAVPKKVVKGARLSMYPAGMHIFRWSRNCVKPTVTKCTASKAEKIVEGQPMVYESTIRIEDTDSGFTNTYNRRTYNKIRKEAESDRN